MSRAALERLLAPRSVALFGGGWTDAVAAASRKIGYAGELWRVHPARPSTPAQQYFRSVEELPGAPDAAFLAAPNREVPAIAAALAARGAGGFVCFAAGFSETGTRGRPAPHRGAARERGRAAVLRAELLWLRQLLRRRRAAGPIRWSARGASAAWRSSARAARSRLTLLFNDRSLPIGLVVTVGNQTRLAAEDLIELLAADERVTAFGLYLEGVKDVGRFAQAVAAARAAGKPDRTGQGRAHRRGCPHRTHPHRRARRRGCGLRCLLPPGGHRPLRLARYAVRDAQGVSLRRAARRQARARHGGLGWRHGHDGRRLTLARTRLRAAAGRERREPAGDPRASA